jgi:fucose 4-O-acetylase-like acetyltransferase
MKQKREIWIDITKGLGIIGVVLGHSGNEIAHHYLFLVSHAVIFYTERIYFQSF